MEASLRGRGERWFPEGSKVVRYEEAGLEVGACVKGENARLNAAEAWAVGYYGKAIRPSFNYTFRSVERMEAFIKEKIEAGRASLEYRAKAKAERAAKLAAPNPLEVGDILVETWGYEQTNVNYYQVLERFGKRGVVIREIASESIPGTEGFMSCRVKPKPGAFLEKAAPTRHIVGPNGEVKMRNWGSWARKCSPNDTQYCSWYA